MPDQLLVLQRYGYGRQQNWRLQIMQANWQQFWSPCHQGNTARCASLDGVHPWLHAKPLNAAVGRVPMQYCPGSHHGWQFWMTPNNTNKTQLLPSFLMVDWCKKAKQFWNPKWILYSCHQCNKLRTNKIPYYSSWRAQLHFELSNVVTQTKIQKVINHEWCPRKPVGQIWPYSG